MGFVLVWLITSLTFLQPTHSYMKFLYKYPQRPYPYEQLVNQSRSRNRDEGEYEILDTGIFDDNCYWDVIVEVSRASPSLQLIISTADLFVSPVR